MPSSGMSPEDATMHRGVDSHLVHTLARFGDAPNAHIFTCGFGPSYVSDRVSTAIIARISGCIWALVCRCCERKILNAS